MALTGSSSAPSASASLEFAHTHPGLAGPTTAMQVLDPAPAVTPAPRPYHFAVRSPNVDKAHGLSLRAELQAAQPGPVNASVYDSHGRLIRGLVDLSDPHGPIVIQWDGTLADGKEAPGGSYQLRVQGPDKVEKAQVKVIRP
jgi:flagellar hook assembly protein FlgD